jgi:hypothetical protein
MGSGRPRLTWRYLAHQMALAAEGRGAGERRCCWRAGLSLLWTVGPKPDGRNCGAQTQRGRAALLRGDPAPSCSGSPTAFRVCRRSNGPKTRQQPPQPHWLARRLCRRNRASDRVPGCYCHTRPAPLPTLALADRPCGPARAIKAEINATGWTEDLEWQAEENLKLCRGTRRGARRVAAIGERNFRTGDGGDEVRALRRHRIGDAVLDDPPGCGGLTCRVASAGTSRSSWRWMSSDRWPVAFVIGQ